MATVSVEHVAALLGRALTAAEQVRSARLLEFGEAAVEDALPGFSVAVGTEEAIVIPHGGEVWTPRYPVSAVNSVTVAGSEVDAAAFTFTEKGLIRFVRSVAWPFDRDYPTLGTTVVVDYDFGLDPPPAAVANVVAASVVAVLRRQASNADGVLSESIDGYSVTFDRDEVRSLAVSVDPAALRRWSRTRQVSVPLVSNG